MSAKREFMLKFIFNRTIAVTGGLDGTAAVRNAEAAWDELNKICPQLYCNVHGPLDNCNEGCTALKILD